LAARKNPSNGGKPDKLMRSALILALHREAADPEGKPTKRLHLVANALVKAAETGDVSAIREIFDRVEGKPRQEVETKNEHTGKDGGPIQHAVSWEREVERVFNDTFSEPEPGV
jgi:hypothetical protein